MNRTRPRPARGLLLLAALAVLAPIAAFLILDAVFPFPENRLSPAPSTVVFDRNGRPLRFYLAPDHAWRFPVTLAETAPVLTTTLMASEDRYFRLHPGINPLALARAALGNLLAGRVTSGGSTITMQVARLIEPKPRTLWAKIVEMFRAAQIETRHTKDEILAAYLNLAPFGGNIVGVGAAAYFYFGKPPDRLSLGEAALLTALPRAPSRFDPARDPGAATRARDMVLDQLAGRGAIGPKDAAEAKAVPVPAHLVDPPFLAPHICDLARARRPGQARLRTTLDPFAQKAAEEILKGRMERLRALGIGSAATVILDRKTRDVLAMVGSPYFFDAARSGQINGAVIRRSPGSALKPFLYAKAMDAGLIVPESPLLDIPTAFAGYSPKNYDGLFRGRVTAEKALITSLNVPAVRLLDAVGQQDFHALLVRGGLTTLDKPASHYGLSLILGGGEVTLLSLAGLYATLADGGEHVAPRLFPDSPTTGIRLFSPEACALVTEILAQVERPDLPGGFERVLGVPAVAWKTGTSYGHRDAWAFGFSAEHVIGVWVGNMDATPVKGISGTVHAGPILFELFRAVETAGSRLPDPGPLNIAEVEVCAESHCLPGPFCDRRITVKTIPGKTRLAPCPIHKQIHVDVKTGLRLAGGCLERHDSRPEIVTEYPAELCAWWRSAGIAFASPPPPHPDCAEVAGGEPPRIVSPSASAPYTLRRDVPASFQRLSLSANVAAPATKVYWYQDGLLVAHGPAADRLFVDLSPGRHRLVAMDDLGRMDAVTYFVE
ncbi:penicillin-binding protein 1C [Desulfolutivibrio sulfoxidireducens]|uniref:penicillin-binding protein 1C n=1 Tax=Desulfolutivibrio sulfoxidireducens TaxID=2773299 RepID=UPI00159DCB48|nr:penicillin-binding protein 1C [Desulfolutivibrio sulfoxidireducens]QLA16986.1 penicillin-binding protein 1C [Desulfolutivibrio sulfoxidireducens]